MIIKKIAVLPLGYALAIIYAILGFFHGLFVFFQLQTSLVSYMDRLALPILTKFGFWIILLCPAFMLLIGFVTGIVIAALYNFVVIRLAGGIKLSVSE